MIAENVKFNHDEEKKAFGMALAKIRKDKQMKLHQLAMLSCVSLSTLKRMENGTGNITLENMLDIARALDVSLAYICLCAFRHEQKLVLDDEQLKQLGQQLLEQAVKKLR